MKILFLFALIAVAPLGAQETKSYESILWDYAKPDDTFLMRKIQSDYEPSIQKCFKRPLANYNVTFRNQEAEWKFKESLICYREENEKLPKEKRVDFEDCKDRALRNESYDLAYCYQGLFVKAHNYHGY